MFVRDMLDATMLRQQDSQQFLGDVVDDVTGVDVGPDPLLQELQNLARMMVHQRALATTQINNIANADAEVDWGQLDMSLQSIRNYKRHFQEIAAQRSAETQQMYQLTGLDRVINDMAAWAESVLAYLPRAIAAIPNAILQGLGDIAKTGGEVVTGALVPWLIGGALVLAFVKQAETSRTYRAKVA